MPSTDRWLDEIQRQLRRGKHVLLHGNVRDLALWNGEFLTFRAALDAALADTGYTLRASYDPSGCVSFVDSAMRTRFMGLQPGVRAASAPAPRTLPGQRPVDSGARVDKQGSSGETEERSLSAPDVALHAIRNVLRDAVSELAVAQIVFSEKLVTPGENQTAAERSLLLVLDHAAEEAYRHLSGRRAGMRNGLVLVASSLGQVPPWLYRDHPLFSIIQVERPMGDARREYLRQTYDGFFGKSEDGPIDAIVELFTALTDGFSYWDLEALRLSSHHAKIGISACRRLVDFFKHGIKDDPWRKLALRSRDELGRFLSERVVGQDIAIHAVTDVLISAIGGIHADGPGQRSVRPKGVLFFVGPTGVGKTELAKRVTELVFGDATAFARFDMSEYQQEHAAERLTGAPPSYVGYEAGGQLTNHIKRRPFSVVLFDEIEKAHPRVLDKFLQVLDDGRLTDGQGETVYFSQTLLIFTSNIGATIRSSENNAPISAISPDMTVVDIIRHFKTAVRAHFVSIGRPELLGRIGEENVVVFDMLRPSHVSGILDKFISGVAEQLHEQYGLTLQLDDKVRSLADEYCLDPENARLGGRAIRNFVEKVVVVPINEMVVQRTSTGTCLHLFVRDGRVIAVVEPA